MKKSLKAYRLLLPALILILSACAVQKKAGVKEGVNLVYKSSPGSSFIVNSQMHSSVVTEQMGQTMEVEVTAGSQSAYSTLATNNDGTLMMDMEIKSMEQVSKSPMGDDETDFKPWLGKKVGFQITPKGEVSEFTGLDQIKSLTAVTGETMTSDFFERTVRNAFIKLPDHPVKAGDSWSQQDTLEMQLAGGAIRQEETITYTIAEKVTLDGIECLKILAEGLGKMTGEMEQQGMALEITRTTKTTGVLHFALEKGFFHSMEYNSSAIGEIYVPVASMSIPQKVTTKMALTVVF